MDRFVTTRSAMDVEAAHLNLTNENEHGDGATNADKEAYQKRQGSQTLSQPCAVSWQIPACLWEDTADDSIFCPFSAPSNLLHASLTASDWPQA